MMSWFSGSVADVAAHPMTSADVRPAADIHGAVFARGWTDGEIEQLILKPNVHGLIARSRGDRRQPAGFVLSRHAADEAEILTIAVAPAFQRRGVGRLLMGEVIARAHADRIASLFLEVDEANPAALALYRRLGFAPVGQRPDYYRERAGKPTGAVVMRLDMPGPRPARQS